MNETKFTNEYIIALAKTMTPGNAEQVIARWKMSTDEANLLRFLDVSRDIPVVVPDAIMSIALGYIPQAHLVNLCVMQGRVGVQELVDFVLPEMPISGKDVLDMGIKPGPKVGKLLRQVKADWAGANFTTDRSLLLEWLAEYAKEM